MFNQLGAIPLSDDILRKANIGLWAFELDEGKPPRMYVDDAMLGLIGLKEQVSPEETYHAWYDHIDEGSYDLVAESVEKMISGEHAEVQYPWHHPDGHTFVVRCGGMRNFGYTTGVRIEGTHQNVTEVIHFQEEKNKALIGEKNAFNRYFLSPYFSAYYIDFTDLSWKIYKRSKVLEENYPENETYIESLGRFIETEVHPDDREKARILIRPDDIRVLLDAQKSFSFNVRKISEDKMKYLKCEVVRGVDRDHIALGFRDATEDERLRAEQERAQSLASQQRHIKAFGDMINAALWSIDINQDDEIIAVEWSDEFRHMFGFNDVYDFPNTIEAWSSRLHPEDEKVAMDNFWDSIKSRNTTTFVYNIKYRVRRKTGEYCWYHAIGRMEGNDDGTRRMYGIIRDISADKKLEEALEKINQLFEDSKQSNEFQDNAIRQFMGLMQNSEDDNSFINELVRDVGQYFDADRAYIFEKDPTGQFVDNTYEWCADGVIQEIDNLQKVPVHVIDPWVNEFRKKGSFFISCDDDYAKKEPIVYEVLEPQGISSLMAAPLIDHGKIIGFLGVDNPKAHIEHKLYLFVSASILNHEILAENQRKIEEKYKEALQQSSEEAKAANEAKTAFLFNMSHDIRTPMNAILGYTSIGLDHVKDPDVSTDCYNKIKMAGGHLLSLINDILEMSRIEAGRLELTEDPIDIREAINGVHDMSMSLALPKEIDLETIKGDIRNPYIYSDELHINEVIINLISNAVKYTPNGGKVIYSINQVGDVENGIVKYRFDIKDNGIGMSEEFQTHLFEAFVREEKASVSKTEGAGLGLSIVKKIVDLAGGTISCKSKTNEGSTFTVELPFKVMDEEAIKKFEAEKNKANVVVEENDLTGKKVLLVDDNDFNREVGKFVLNNNGLVVEEASDGKIAVDTVKTKGIDYYDFILMDIQMPVMDGYQAAKEIRILPGGNKVHIVALSANAFKEDIEKSLANGMDAHIAKPINNQVLIETLNKLLGSLK